jgi:hypothetical protein
LLSETHLEPRKKFFIKNYHFYWTERFPGRKGETDDAVRKNFLYNHVDLPPLASIEATGACKQIGNIEVPLAAGYKSPGHAKNNADIIELLSFRHKFYW